MTRPLLPKRQDGIQLLGESSEHSTIPQVGAAVNCSVMCNPVVAALKLEVTTRHHASPGDQRPLPVRATAAIVNPR